jgi:formylglycine-generating enzyme required for sulfatase activity
MTALKAALFVALTLIPSSNAQNARFFRIAGPVATTITALSADGSLTWTNAATNAIFTVQTATNLIGPGNWVDYIQVPVTNEITTHRTYDPNPPSGMVLIPAGWFTMGDSLDGATGALPLHQVYVSAVYVDRYDVTKALWDVVWEWAIAHGYSFDNGGSGKAADHPVQTINWYDCLKWCNARSEMENRTPAYYTSAAQTVVYRTGQVDVGTNWVKWNSGYRLPTEAEFEKASRGGLNGQRFPWGTTITESQANYYAITNSYSYDLGPNGYNPIGDYPNTSPGTSPVGAFAPNGYGLYDMAGNVYQWCWDRYTSYSSASQTDPHGPPSGSYRLLRGGSWGSVAPYCRASGRGNTIPSRSDSNFGFRSVLPPGQ